MSINFAILGLLSVAPMSGYQLKKVMQESSFMYWSGNNNQIYKALLELQTQGYVTYEVKHQEKSPSKKIYTITDRGLEELKEGLKIIPDVPEIKNPFLVQIAWSDMLSSKDITILLADYEKRIKDYATIEQMKKERSYFSPARTPREKVLWDLIYDNIISSYSKELDWIAKVREVLKAFPDSACEFVSEREKEDQEESRMTYQIMEKDGKKYLLLDSSGKLIESEQDGLDIISLCAQNDTNRLLIQSERLSSDFLQLRTGLAGAIVQKFTNYGIKAVVVMAESQTAGRFKEFMAESNKGSMFRAYADFEAAQQWLTS